MLRMLVCHNVCADVITGLIEHHFHRDYRDPGPGLAVAFSA
jgi:hypothetical protein